MGYLSGLREYLDEAYNISIFDQALASGHPWKLHIHKHRIIKAGIIENFRYDVKVSVKGIISRTNPFFPL